MKEYEKLCLNTVSETVFKAKKGKSLDEACNCLGECSLASVNLQNENGEITEKERVWMAASGTTWVRTSGFASVWTVKGVFNGRPVVRQSKFEKAKLSSLDEAKKLLGVCSLCKVVLCDEEDLIVMQDGKPREEMVWLSLSWTYWVRAVSFDDSIGFVL